MLEDWNNYSSIQHNEGYMKTFAQYCTYLEPKTEEKKKIFYL